MRHHDVQRVSGCVRCSKDTADERELCCVADIDETWIDGGQVDGEDDRSSAGGDQQIDRGIEAGSAPKAAIHGPGVSVPQCLQALKAMDPSRHRFMQDSLNAQ